ncbi:MAG: TIGR00341 family protein [Saprospiraceae bacterium]
MSRKAPTPAVLLRMIRVFFQDLFNLNLDKAADHETIEYIRKNVVFRGANLWILIFAIMVASIGLNKNSAAVIIGAMLISPLMGPIMGVGLGMGINDIPLILKSAKNLAIAVLISIVTSALYFALSPLNDAQSELLSRKSPDIFDVLIAFFGGLAGIVAGSRQEKSNAIPGVAIATALMPPLCTAGFGLGTLQFDYFWGGFYLFFINGVFISLATWIIVRFLNYPHVEFIDPKRERRTKQLIFVLTLITIIPSAITAIHVVQESIFKNKVNQFVDNEIRNGMMKRSVISRDIYYTRDSSHITLFLSGNPIPTATIQALDQRLREDKDYILKNFTLEIHPEAGKQDTVNYANMIREMGTKLQTEFFQTTMQRNQEEIEQKESRIRTLEQQLQNYSSHRYPLDQIARQLREMDPHLKTISLARLPNFAVDSSRTDSITVAMVQFDRKPNAAKLTEIKSFLAGWTRSTEIRLIVN